MNVRGIAVVGTHTTRYEESVRFFAELLNLQVEEDTETFTAFGLPDAGRVEVFKPSHVHGPGDVHTTAPVPEFLVDDVAAGRAELEAAGIELLGPIREHPTFGSWQLFRAPDGNVYGLASGRPEVTRR